MKQTFQEGCFVSRVHFHPNGANVANGARKEHSQIATEILAKFEPHNIPETITPDINVAATLAVAHALLAINTQLARLGNEISSAKMMLQAIANRPHK
jgi:hypothetical protein